MMPRPHPETNENQHKRFAQHIGSPRRGVFILDSNAKLTKNSLWIMMDET
jgi:hypothetical protein